jgi:hypothetical protein
LLCYFFFGSVFVATLKYIVINNVYREQKNKKKFTVSNALKFLSILGVLFQNKNLNKITTYFILIVILLKG